MLCDDLEGWDGSGGRGRLKREGICIHTEPIHVVVQQKLMQHCKAIILQLKNKLKNTTVPFPSKIRNT